MAGQRLEHDKNKHHHEQKGQEVRERFDPTAIIIIELVSAHGFLLALLYHEGLDVFTVLVRKSKKFGPRKTVL